MPYNAAVTKKARLAFLDKISCEKDLYLDEARKWQEIANEHASKALYYINKAEEANKLIEILKNTLK